jgi:hypothetical protein
MKLPILLSVSWSLMPSATALDSVGHGDTDFSRLYKPKLPAINDALLIGTHLVGMDLFRRQDCGGTICPGASILAPQNHILY